MSKSKYQQEEQEGSTSESPPVRLPCCVAFFQWVLLLANLAAAALVVYVDINAVNQINTSIDIKAITVVAPLGIFIIGIIGAALRSQNWLSLYLFLLILVDTIHILIIYCIKSPFTPHWPIFGALIGCTVLAGIFVGVLTRYKLN